MDHVTGGGPVFTGTGPAIDIDTRSLGSFAALLEGDLNGTVRPGIDRLLATFAGGAGFGSRNPGEDVRTAVTAYHDCLVATTQQLAAYINATTILVDAARRITTEYTSADALAGASTAKVTQALSSAIATASAAAPPTPARLE